MNYKKQILHEKIQKYGYISLLSGMITGVIYLIVSEELTTNSWLFITAISLVVIGMIILIATQAGEAIRLLHLGYVLLAIGVFSTVYYLTTSEFNEISHGKNPLQILSRYIAMGGIISGFFFLLINKLKNH